MEDDDPLVDHFSPFQPLPPSLQPENDALQPEDDDPLVVLHDAPLVVILRAMLRALRFLHHHHALIVLLHHRHHHLHDFVFKNLRFGRSKGTVSRTIERSFLSSSCSSDVMVRRSELFSLRYPIIREKILGLAEFFKNS